MLLFKKTYQEAIRSGRKITTIRRWSRARVRAGKRAFSPGLGWLHIEAIEVIDLKALTDDDAMQDGFATAGQMRRQLRSLYPRRARDGKQWFRVRFRMTHRMIHRRDAEHAKEDLTTALSTRDWIQSTADIS